MKMLSTILELIDDIQRLGLSYHFEEDIRRALNRIMFAQGTNVRLEKGVHAIALYFRLCRQHGFEISHRTGTVGFVEIHHGSHFDNLNR
ncbi:hypothetical protein ACSBR1_012362 [Camellia fascicularis]